MKTVRRNGLQSDQFGAGHQADADDEDRILLIWMIELGQRGDDSLKPGDSEMLRRFVTPVAIAHARHKPSPVAVYKLAAEVRRFMLDRSPWNFPVKGVLFVDWFGPNASGAWMFTDWQTTFRFRAVNLLKGYGSLVRKCLREGCERLFVAVKRQVYCSAQCSQRARFAKHWHGLSAEARYEKRREWYIKQIRKVRGSAAANRAGKRTPKGE
jgi:hypothetical protein